MITPTHAFLLLFFSLFAFLRPIHCQDPPDGFHCTANTSIYPCQAYAFYRADVNGTLAQADLASVGDLFETSRLSIARASNLTTAAALRQNQPLLIPLSCSCAALNRSHRAFAPVHYQINGGDTFYLVSLNKFGNLTTWTAVVRANPALVPTNLSIGDIATFPISCQCLNSTEAAAAAAADGRRPLGLVTYVMQPSDTYATVAASFGTDAGILTNLNGPENTSDIYTAIFVPLYEIPPPILRSNNSSGTPAPPPPAAGAVVIKKRGGVVAGLAVGLGVAAAAAAAQMLLLWWVWRRFLSGGRWRVSAEGFGGVQGKGGGMEISTAAEEEEKLVMGDVAEWLDKYKVYKVEELMGATGEFGNSNLISGSVYRGEIDGELFAIKKMKWNAREELKILQKVNHTNLVKLQGFCIDNDSGACYLVYEYMANGSLDSWLHSGEASRKALEWRTRLRIALDLAHGLQYIHEHTTPRVVHKDVKSSNVLLDAGLHAKLANFGLARTGVNAVTTHIVGTQGYIAPEHLADGVVTAKVDVFAFGVVLLELASGRPAVDETGRALWGQVEDSLLFGGRGGGEEEEEEVRRRVRAWMDPVLREQPEVESVAAVVNVARECVRKNPAMRPTMVEVSYNLSKVADEVFSDYYGESRSMDIPDSAAGR